MLWPKLFSLLLSVLLVPSLGGADSSKSNANDLPAHIARLVTETKPMNRQLNEELNQGRSIREEDPRKQHVRMITAQIQTLTRRYLTTSKTDFVEIKIDKDEFLSFLISPNKNGSWINKLAHRLQRNGVKLLIRPFQLRTGVLGIISGDGSIIMLPAPPFSGFMEAILAHEFYHSVIMNSKYPHLLKGQLQTTANPYQNSYQNFDFSELGAFAESVAREEESLRWGFERLFYFSESLENYLNLAERALTKGDLDVRFTLVQNEGSESYDLAVHFAEEGLAFHNHILRETEGHALGAPLAVLTPPAPGLPRQKIWKYKEIPHKIQELLASRLQLLRRLNLEFLAMLRSVPEKELEELASIPRLSTLPKQKLQELNQKWLDALQLPSTHPARSFEQQADCRELLM